MNGKPQLLESSTTQKWILYDQSNPIKLGSNWEQTERFGNEYGFSCEYESSVCFQAHMILTMGQRKSIISFEATVG